MRPWWRATLGSVALAGVAACAPYAAYRGPVPAPGASLALATSRDSRPGPAANPGSSRTASAPLQPAGTDRAHHYLGTLALPAGAESLIVVLYGDNRPGYRIESRGVELAAVRHLSWRPTTWLGLLFVPVLLVEAIVPTLDGPRDLITLFTHRPAGGREKAVLKSIQRMQEAGLVVSLGDVVTDGRRGRLWEDYAARHAPLRERVLTLATPGNHERLFSEVARDSWDAVIGPPAAPERYWCAFDVPEAQTRFVFLDSNVLTDRRSQYPDSLENVLAEEQLAWADSILDSSIRYKLVLFHHPLVSAGHHVADWAPERPARRRERLLEICARRGVTAVITGHEHVYQRLYLRTKDGGFWHITTGGGGSPLYRIPHRAWREAMDRPLPAGVSLERGSELLEAEHHICRLALPRDRPSNSGRSLPFEVRRVFARGGTRLIETLDLAQPPSRQ